jgi:hypothetical protein
MKSRYLFIGVFSIVLLLGAGCAAKNTVNQNNATTTINVTVQEQITNNTSTSNKSGTTIVTEPEYNTPILQEKEPDYMKKNASYFFVVENKNNNLGNDSEYGILSVRKNCESFGIVLLTKDQPLNLSTHKNKAIVWKEYEVHGGEYTLKEIAEDTTSKQEIDNFKKACPDPFGRYIGSSLN